MDFENTFVLSHVTLFILMFLIHLKKFVSVIKPFFKKTAFTIEKFRKIDDKVKIFFVGGVRINFNAIDSNFNRRLYSIESSIKI